jgi:hypothetical protein
VSLILDAGALLAIERGDRAMARRLKAELLAGARPQTHGGVVAQTWRGGGARQARLARALPALEVASLDDDLGRRAGVLLGRAGRSDAIDAAVVALADHADRIVTSDPDDINHLVATLGLRVDVIPV